ncbi:MAG: molybdate ABC transporter substrate-binding protein [Jatrophihabitantaceae bacterium]
MNKLMASIAALGLIVTGCSSSTPAANPGSGSSALSGSITVFAAASLTGTFTQLKTQFEQAHPGTTVKLNFGGSSALATQIDQGAPADVFASAATTNMDTVVKAGNARSSTVFVKNTMEIAAAPGNPAHIDSVSDLAGRGVKVALCDPTVPCGVVAAEVFAKANVTVKPVSLEADVKSTLAKVELREVDAGVVYVTDVRAAGTKVVGVPIPADLNASTDYPIAALTHAPNASLARAFVAYVESAPGQQVLAAAGFVGP